MDHLKEKVLFLEYAVGELDGKNKDLETRLLGVELELERLRVQCRSSGDSQSEAQTTRIVETGSCGTEIVPVHSEATTLRAGTSALGVAASSSTGEIVDREVSGNCL